VYLNRRHSNQLLECIRTETCWRCWKVLDFS